MTTTGLFLTSTDGRKGNHALVPHPGLVDSSNETSLIDCGISLMFQPSEATQLPSSDKSRQKDGRGVRAPLVDREIRR
jgi:hypothetical protein